MASNPNSIEIEATISANPVILNDTKSKTKAKIPPNQSGTPQRINKSSDQITDDDNESMSIHSSDDEEDDDDVSLSRTTHFAANNNNRFGNFLERMDTLERENEILKKRVNEKDETTKKYIYETYEVEIADTRRLLDDITQGKATLEIDISRLDNELKDRNTDYRKLEKEADNVTKNLEKTNRQMHKQENVHHKLKRDFDELATAFHAIKSDNKKWIDERKSALVERDMFSSEAKKAIADKEAFEEKNKLLENTVAKQRNRVDELRKHVEKEAMLRVNLENKLQTITEKYEFDKRIHHDEMSQSNSMKYNTGEKDVDSRVALALDELREDHEIEIETAVNKLHYQYKSQVDSLKAKLASIEEEKRDHASQVRNLELTNQMLEKNHSSTITSLQTELESKTRAFSEMNQTLRDLTTEKEKINVDLISRKGVWADTEARLNRELKNLQDTIDKKDLYESKLRAEIGTFGTMMDHAETRHKVVSPTKSKQLQQRAMRRKKRRLSQLNRDRSDTVNATPTSSPLAKQRRIPDDTSVEPENSPGQKDCIIM